MTRVEVVTENDRSLTALTRAIQLSMGQFSLVFVRCNYAALRERMLQRLYEETRNCASGHDGAIEELVLPQNVQTLYTTIQATTVGAVPPCLPSALMVLGLESVVALDNLLASTNQIRDEFRKRLSFPVVLWVNDEVLQKLVRFAPDFSSWAATPIKFALATDELIDFLSSQADSLFAAILVCNADKFPHNSTIERLRGQHRLELESALRDLQSRGVKLEPKIDAGLQFIFGQDDYTNDRIDSAINRYRDSLMFWRNSNNLERQGVLLFHLGLCYCRNADRYPAETTRHLEEAWTYLQQCVNVFEEAGRKHQVAQFITQLEEVLHRLEAWSALQPIVQKSLSLHQICGSQLQLAVDYGLLAKIAFRQSRWEDANKYATLALSTLTEKRENQSWHLGFYRSLLEQLYRLLLVKSQRCLGQVQEAANNLEKCARELENVIQASVYSFDPHRYLRILVQLRSLYFELGRYREAFQIKQEQRSVEQQYGFRAFIGAGQLQPERVAVNPALATVEPQGNVASAIAASGRQQDINRLLERISRPDYKLTVIHGPSGVGKSSIVAAGLVPALKSSPIGDQIALPVVVRVYRDWVAALGRDLAQELESLNLTYLQLDNQQAILEQLRKNEERHLLTILIFDQLEEFFLVCSKLEQRREFYEFFQKCFNFTSVQVILSIREDFLNHLLELEQFVNLEKFNINILDKNTRYPLGNFSPKDAKAVIKSLTERANFKLENALIDRLVEDLAIELGEVRPVELQVVGAQLQAENITTLEKYQQFGPKQRLVERFLEKTIKDCGSENERDARLILYLLTDENGNRPLKTRAELASDLAEEVEKLDLILEILVESGLVFLIPEVPANRYQLVHDYLVTFIRQKEQLEIRDELTDLRNKDELNQTEIEQLRSEKELLAELADTRYQIVQDYLKTLIPSQESSGLLAELHELRKRKELSKFAIEQLREEKELLVELAYAKEEHKRSEERRKRLTIGAIAGSAAAIFALTVLAISAVTQSKQAVLSEIKAVSASSEARFASHEEIDALKEGLRAGIKLKRSYGVQADTQTQQQVETVIQQVVYGIRESNRLEGHTAGVYSVSFSPDGQSIASASADTTVKLWRKDGTLLPRSLRHGDRVSSVSFSPDGQLIATASWDTTVKLWRRDGTLLQTLMEHDDKVLFVTFSPDGQTLASASADNTVKLWRKDGRCASEVQERSIRGATEQHQARDFLFECFAPTAYATLKGHTEPVTSVSFSPDGQTIASASADNTIKLWQQDGRLVRTLKGHSDQVTSVSFSRDGQIIASASADNTVKLWRRNGSFVKTLSGHTQLVNGVSFSPDDRTIATASFDKTIKLWRREDGALLKTLSGHSNWVSSVSFNTDGKTLASASRDKTIRLWSLDKKFPLTLNGFGSLVNAVSFSRDGQTVVTASDDKTVKLWRKDGTLLQILQGHTAEVNSVRFSYDGRLIVSASADKTVKLWRRNGTDGSYTDYRTLEGHQDSVLAVSFSPDGQAIASASRDNTVKLWSRNGILLNTLKGNREPVNGVSFSPDSQIIASASEDHTVKLWNRDGTLLKTLEGHTNGVWGVSFSSDGETLASASLDNTVKLWRKDGTDGSYTAYKTLEGHGDGVASVSFSLNGQTLASASLDNTIRLWSNDGVLLKTIKVDGDSDGVISVSFSPDGQTIASASEGKVILWNLADLNLDNLLVRGCGWLRDYLKTNRNAKSDRALCDGINIQR